MPIPLPDNFNFLNARVLERKCVQDNLTDSYAKNDPTYMIGFAPIFNLSDGNVYKVTGGNAIAGWEFESIFSGGEIMHPVYLVPAVGDTAQIFRVDMDNDVFASGRGAWGFYAENYKNLNSGGVVIAQVDGPDFVYEDKTDAHTIIRSLSTPQTGAGRGLQFFISSGLAKDVNRPSYEFLGIQGAGGLGLRYNDIHSRFSSDWDQNTMLVYGDGAVKLGHASAANTLQGEGSIRYNPVTESLEVKTSSGFEAVGGSSDPMLRKELGPIYDSVRYDVNSKRPSFSTTIGLDSVLTSISSHDLTTGLQGPVITVDLGRKGIIGPGSGGPLKINQDNAEVSISAYMDITPKGADTTFDGTIEVRIIRVSDSAVMGSMSASVDMIESNGVYRKYSFNGINFKNVTSSGDEYYVYLFGTINSGSCHINTLDLAISAGTDGADILKSGATGSLNMYHGDYFVHSLTSANQVFSLSNPKSLKKFRLEFTDNGGTLGAALFTGYTLNWLDGHSIGDYDPGNVHILECEIDRTGSTMDVRWVNNTISAAERGFLDMTGVSTIDMTTYKYAEKSDLSSNQQFTITNPKLGELIIMIPKNSGGSLHEDPFLISGSDTITLFIANSLNNFNEAFDAQLKLQIFKKVGTVYHANAWIIE